MNYKDEFYAKLDSDKIKINNRNPVRMDLFLSFLTIPVVKIKDHLGSSTGWTRYENIENGLIISGGICRFEYLDSIQYKKNPSNAYNNYVNPFFIFDILNEEGKAFFVDYYKDDILKIINETKSKLDSATKRVTMVNDLYKGIVKETDELFKSSKLKMQTSGPPESGPKRDDRGGNQ